MLHRDSHAVSPSPLEGEVGDAIASTGGEQRRGSGEEIVPVAPPSLPSPSRGEGRDFSLPHGAEAGG